MPSILNATTSSGLVTSADNSGSLQLATNNGTTAVTIDTSQNVGIGTASPQGKLNVSSNSAIGGNNISQLVVDQASDGGAATLTLRSLFTNTSNTNKQVANINLGVVTDGSTNTNADIRFSTIGSNTLTEQARITSAGLLQFNSGFGSVATAYGCRAWVNFNGTGTVAIRASGNVSSITDGGTGLYGVNLTTAMPDANYASLATCNESAAGSGTGVIARISGTNASSAFSLETVNLSAGRFDAANVFASVFR